MTNEMYHAVLKIALNDLYWSTDETVNGFNRLEMIKKIEKVLDDGNEF